jgi:hypothetical protein
LASVLSFAALAALTGGIAFSSAAAAEPGIDHFQCYLSEGAPVPGSDPKPSAVWLKNSESDDGFLGSIGNLLQHCNPVQKTLPDGTVTPVSHQLIDEATGEPDSRSGHLACYRLRPNAGSSTGVAPMHFLVTNQFGTGQVVTGAPTSLCLPAWKSDASPEGLQWLSPEPFGLDHYTCYPAKYQLGPNGRPLQKFKPPKSVRLDDSFGGFDTKVRAPRLLCLASAKIIDPADPPEQGVLNPADHMLCFGDPAPAAPADRTVFDRNQFHTTQVSVEHASMLCVPSTTEDNTPPVDDIPV